MSVNFWKTEALSNDFVLVEISDVAGLDLDALAQSICDRHRGVGSDGLLVLDPHQPSLRMFNPDGTEDFCGNGLRCAIDHLSWKHGYSGTFQIIHRGLPTFATVHDTGEVSVRLPAPSFKAENVPLDSSVHPEELWLEPVQGVIGSAISTGSTHFVALSQELPNDHDFFRLSPLIEVDSLFPTHTSVIWTRAGSGCLELRIWERSVGETFGCGTGSAAAACVVARLTGVFGKWTVLSRGGKVTVTVPNDFSSVTLTSGVSRVYSGVYLSGATALAPK